MQPWVSLHLLYLYQTPASVEVAFFDFIISVRRILCKERFLLEMEKCIVKLRWAVKDKGLLEEVDFETMVTDEERKKIDELAEVEEAMTKSVFNHDDLVVDFRKLKM
jgi:hypothetical protein